MCIGIENQMVMMEKLKNIIRFSVILPWITLFPIIISLPLLFAIERNGYSIYGIFELYHGNVSIVLFFFIIFLILGIGISFLASLEAYYRAYKENRKIYEYKFFLTIKYLFLNLRAVDLRKIPSSYKGTLFIILKKKGFLNLFKFSAARLEFNNNHLSVNLLPYDDECIECFRINYENYEMFFSSNITLEEKNELEELYSSIILNSNWETYQSMMSDSFYKDFKIYYLKSKKDLFLLKELKKEEINPDQKGWIYF